MKVYILKKHIDYEGFEIAGVFNDKELGTKVITCMKAVGLDSYGHFTLDEHEVIE